MLISPRSTLMSRGSVSIRVERRNWPIRVGFRAHLGSVPSGSCAMVRKLSIWKRRLRRPIQLCLSKTGPGPSNLIASDTKSISGKVTVSNAQAITMSARRHIRSGSFRLCTRWRYPRIPRVGAAYCCWSDGGIKRCSPLIQISIKF